MACLKRLLVSACSVLLITAQMAAGADRITPQMVSAALEGQGYTVESITRTLLGRVRVIASLGTVWREIVLDTSSGQILRDYAVEFTPADLPNPTPGDMPRGGEVIENNNELSLRN